MGAETWEGEVLTTLQLAHNEEYFPPLLGSGSPALLQPISLFFFLLFFIFFLMSTQTAEDGFLKPLLCFSLN